VSPLAVDAEDMSSGGRGVLTASFQPLHLPGGHKMVLFRQSACNGWF
jgi:hypothetical protein